MRRFFKLSLALTAAVSAMTADRVLAEDRNDLAAKAQAIALSQFEKRDLNSILVEVLVEGDPILTLAHGEAMPGVPVTPEGQFRNGAVALAYMGALTLRLAEEGLIDLDVPIDRWLPDLPASEQATIRTLANMTAGYPDHVANQDGFVERLYADPFHHWTPEELIETGLANERAFAPGANWDYSHTGFVILGQVLEAATGEPLDSLMRDYVLDPLELNNTISYQTPEIPDPVVHAYTAERGVWEDSTFWHPSWTLPEGAVQVTTISDMARSFDAIVGHDGFLSEASRQQMIEPVLIGFGSPLEGCPTCHTLTSDFSYGLGVVLRDDWVFQTPLFGGYASAVATLPAGHSAKGRVTIAVAATFTQQSFSDWQGALPNWADETVRLIAAAIVPDNAPPAFRQQRPK